jgi:hypothetical protein
VSPFASIPNHRLLSPSSSISIPHPFFMVNQTFSIFFPPFQYLRL